MSSREMSAEFHLLVILSNRYMDGARQAESLQRTSCDFVKFLAIGRRHSVTPIVFKTVSANELLGLLPKTVIAELQADYYATLKSNIKKGWVLDQVLSRLSDQGIPVILLKGLSIAYNTYHDIGLRPSCDIDLLFHGAHMPEVFKVLSDLSFRGPNDQQATHVSFADGPLPVRMVIECHWNLLSLSYRYGFPLGRIWHEASAFTVGYETCLCLRKEYNLIYLLNHIASSHHLTEASLLHYSDINEILNGRAGLDWDIIVRLCVEYGMATPVYHALSFVRQLYDSPVPKAGFDILRQHARRSGFISIVLPDVSAVESRRRRNPVWKAPLHFFMGDHLWESFKYGIRRLYDNHKDRTSLVSIIKERVRGKRTVQQKSSH